jgi:hypothetical protein
MVRFALRRVSGRKGAADSGTKRKRLPESPTLRLGQANPRSVVTPFRRAGLIKVSNHV